MTTIAATATITVIHTVYVGLALWAAVLLRNPEVRRVAFR